MFSIYPVLCHYKASEQAFQRVFAKTFAKVKSGAYSPSTLWESLKTCKIICRFGLQQLTLSSFNPIHSMYLTLYLELLTLKPHYLLKT